MVFWWHPICKLQAIKSKDQDHESTGTQSIAGEGKEKKEKVDSHHIFSDKEFPPPTQHIFFNISILKVQKHHVLLYISTTNRIGDLCPCIAWLAPLALRPCML